MNDQDKEAFEKWKSEYISTHTGYFKMVGTDDLAQVVWGSACEYKHKEIDELMGVKDVLRDHMNTIGYNQLKKLQAENAKLKATIMLASEASCYTEYEDACGLARQVLKELDDK